MTSETVAEAVARRDRTIVIVGLVVLTVLSWLYLISGSGTGMSVSAMTTWSFPPPLRPAMGMEWDAAYWGLMLAMWWVMMVAMMIPSAAPMILLYARTTRYGQRKGRMAAGPVPTAAFLGGYLAAWFGFSLAATALQWGLERAELLHGMLMWSVNRPLSAGLLAAAGLYQLSPFKAVCLEHCRSPAEHLSRRWRSGSWGAFRMGAEHGAYCLGCCWALMALLFVGGAMNLVWIAGLSILVLVEKVAPFGAWAAKGLGVVCLLAAIWVLAV